MIPRKAEDLETHDVDESGDVLVHAPSQGHVIAVNAVGAAALELIDGERSIDQIVAEIAGVFEGTERGRIETDLRAFLSDLVERGLIALHPAP